MGFPIADGIGLLPPLGILAAGWVIGGRRLTYGVLLSLAGLALMAYLPSVPTNAALIVVGIIAILLPLEIRPPVALSANFERRYAERLRRETARHRLRHNADLTRLAGGLAHEFNNLLTGILGNTNRLRDALGEHTANSEVREIESAVARAGEICGQIVAYTAKGTILRQPLELATFLHDVAADLRPSLPNDPVVTFAENAPLEINADAIQLRRLVRNLLMNAAESHTRPGCPIHIRFGVEPRVDAELERRVWIEIADSGSGIDAKIRDRVCDPFFTTKAPGRGLGLAAAQGIAKAHGGSLSIASSSSGTVVRVELLDRAGQDLIATPAPSQRNTEQADTNSQDDIALVIDDDASIRELAATTLRAAGWTVLTAENGEQGLKHVDQLGKKLNLIILDLLMPVMDGKMTLAALRERKSRVPIVVMSGYSDFDLSGEFTAGGPIMAFFRKPFRPPELMECIAELLEKVSAHD